MHFVLSVLRRENTTTTLFRIEKNISILVDECP
jgi:hypothetical protein